MFKLNHKEVDAKRCTPEQKSMHDESFSHEWHQLFFKKREFTLACHHDQGVSVLRDLALRLLMASWYSHSAQSNGIVAKHETKIGQWIDKRLSMKLSIKIFNI